MQLVFWQQLIRLAEEIQSNISLDQAGGAVIRLDWTSNILMNLGITYLRVVLL
jgi:hypothetical protein